FADENFPKLHDAPSTSDFDPFLSSANKSFFPLPSDEQEGNTLSSYYKPKNFQTLYFHYSAPILYETKCGSPNKDTEVSVSVQAVYLLPEYRRAYHILIYARH